jgi:hypothetical protein
VYYRCVTPIDQERCNQPYSPVKSVDAQLARLYEALRLPPDFITLFKAELQEIVNQRQRLAHRELGGLKRTVDEVEQKEMRLLDEMLAGTVTREVYERMAKTYREKRQQAEARLSQLDVDHSDPMDFLDSCARLASMLGELHQRFGFEQQKSLLRTVFTRIDVRDRTIVNADLNPPFSFFFDAKARTLFKQPPVGGTNREKFEHIVQFTLSSDFTQTKQAVESLMRYCAKTAA